MKLKQGGLIALLSATVALGGVASNTPASAHTLAVPKKPYGCDIHPNQKKCQTGTGGTRVVGGANGKTNGKTGGTRIGGANGNGAGKTGGSRGSSKGSGSGKNGANASGAGANGSSPAPARGQGLPVTGYGGTATNVGASPRSVAAGTQPVVVGLASSSNSQHVTALPATGGGEPSQPASPLLAFFACGLAALGLGLRKVAARH